MPFNTTGRIIASQHRRRTVSGGNGWPSPVSQTPWSCRPWRNVSRSTNTVTSGTRRSGLRAPVINPTIASAFNWSNVRDSSSSGLACSAAIAASNAADTWASASGSSCRWVWHIPVLRSTHRRRLRCRRSRSWRPSPSSPARIRPRSRTSRSNDSTWKCGPTRPASPPTPCSWERPASSSSRLTRASASACPAETSPAARASWIPGNRSHTPARPTAAAASLAERRPSPANTAPGGSQAPCSASRAACRAMRASNASSQLRSRCEDFTSPVSSPRSHTAGSAARQLGGQCDDPSTVHTRESTNTSSRCQIRWRNS